MLRQVNDPSPTRFLQTACASRCRRQCDRHQAGGSTIFDKTGTLTERDEHLIAIVTAPEISADKALRLLSSLEQASHHVLADAVFLAAREHGLLFAFGGVCSP